MGVAVLLCGSWSSSSCMHWRTQSVPPERLVRERPGAELRVTTRDGTRLVLHRPELVGDTLFGARPHPWPRDGRPRLAVTLADVREVAVRRFNAIGTAAAGLGTLALAGVIVLGLLYSARAD